MVTAIIFFTSLGLLFVDPHLTALTWADYPSLKFLINLFTYQLDHNSFNHFLTNFMFMIPYALYLEKRLGSWRFFGFYFGAGLCAALIQAIAIGNSSLVIIGSSGAAFGVFTGACLLFTTKPWQRYLSVVLLTLVILSQFVLALTYGNMGIGYWSHVGGAVGGMLISYYLQPYVKPLSLGGQSQSPHQ